MGHIRIDASQYKICQLFLFFIGKFDIKGIFTLQLRSQAILTDCLCQVCPFKKQTRVRSFILAFSRSVKMKDLTPLFFSGVLVTVKLPYTSNPLFGRFCAGGRGLWIENDVL